MIYGPMPNWYWRLKYGRYIRSNKYLEHLTARLIQVDAEARR